MDLFIAIFTGTIIAATPLIYAALGELVVEKSGVLNLGIEGMMLMGAAFAFWAVIAGLPMPVAILCGALAGVVASLGVLAQYVTLGARRAHARMRVAWTPKLALAGLGLMLLVGLWPVFRGLPPVLQLPPPGAHVSQLGPIELHTSVLFDLGLALLVFGTLVRMVDHFATSRLGDAP